MYKILVGILFTFISTVSFSQGSEPMLGIPKLGISSKIPSASLAPPMLQIESNQTIAGSNNCACLTGCSILPVKLLSFDGHRINTELVQLNWKTGNEMQNLGFDVERSLGNTYTFQQVAFVAAKTTAAAMYEYDLPDSNNFSGISYYRLKQLDVSGAFTYSPTIAIRGYEKQQALSLYPNPVANKLVVDVFSLEKRAAVIWISDAAGKKLVSHSVGLTKGINLFNLSTLNLKSGVYFLQVMAPGMLPLAARLVKL